MRKDWMNLEKLEPSDLHSTSDDQPDDVLFEQAMSDVRKLDKKSRVPRRNGAHHHPPQPDAFAEGRRLLRDFLEGRSEFEWSFHPGYQEGGPEQANRQLLRKLRRGGFSVQEELDLHGMSRVEAQQRLEEFLQDCSRRHVRCVRIIHGKGNNSQNHEGVLKQRIPIWLSTKRLSRMIIAFTSARPADGGLGATYVLLRKDRGPNGSSHK